jgi:hypothetical protein
MNGQSISTSDQVTTCSLNSDDVVKIIKACADARVQELQFNGLSVSFQQHNLTFTAFSHDNGTRSVPDYTPDQEGELDRDEELTRKLLSDPVLYEELVETE